MVHMIGDAVREFIHDVTGGNIYLILLGTFLIFYLDAMVITILPELFILFFYDNPIPGISSLAWLILLMLSFEYSQFLDSSSDRNQTQ